MEDHQFQLLMERVLLTQIEIVDKLEEIRCGIINVESEIQKENEVSKSGILVECREYVHTAHCAAEARHDDIDGDYYMDGAQYGIMEETKTLLDRIDSLTEGVK